MNEQALRFRIGVFVLASLLLLAVLITLFGSFPRLFVRSHEYKVRFADAPGVEPGTPVRRSGVRVGEVKQINLDDESGDVHILIVIENQYTIRRNEQPTLVHGLLGGDTSIDFIPMRGDAEKADHSPVPPGTELAGVRQPSVNTLLTEASEVLPTTQEALNSISKAAQRYEKMAPKLEEAVQEYRDLAKATREMVPELRKTDDEVREMAKATRTAVPKIQQAATDIGELAQSTKDFIPELRKTNDEVRELAKLTRDTVPEVKKTTIEVGEFAKTAREALPELQKTNDQAHAALITWQKTGERAKLILEKNEDKINEAMETLNDDLKRVGRVLSDENQRNLTATLKELPNISKNTDELLKESRLTMRRVNDSLGKADEVMGNLQKATKPLADRSDSIAKNLDESTARMNAVLADVQELLKAIDRGDGTLKKLITDPSLYNHINEAACIVTKLLPKLEPILRDVNVFTDKIARHPESLGVRGAISPSSGLKESPTPLPLPESGPWGKP
jgi:phospholipid/cholesterol/gamma-HCH transport system substrate-binding protein